ncbi:DNA-directed RNA polymeras-like protein I 49 kDa polypeptide [Lentithecium fluviatile CBS 122367]|uniref:DNA-directed RNA polymeras-like protein I 49 kDa polypeptide n=1 Tax=Lentithecium fluviatile CBS 122367 TaxID=1168545 RepID=A0A6G1IFM1_9PLEO|nr:DNA-directed RNA polymeras-like protein I 49 kDa polypeptide [Lentithecium fluviatile CBS 122367]
MSGHKGTSEKKRKRREEGGERPAKKKAIAPPTGNVRVEYLENNDVLGPMLAATPGLNFPSKITFKPYKRSKILPSGEVSDVLLQSSEHARLDYVAREEKDGSSESQLRDYIGVYDPVTGKLQLMPVRRVTVRSTLRSETEELQNQQARIDAVRSTNTTKRHELAKEFGSKKSRKAIEDMSLNSISRGEAGNNVGMAANILQGMSSMTSEMPTTKDLAAAVDSSKPRPQANLATEYPEDVYSTDVVVGRELMESIPVKDWVDASEAGKGVNVGSRFVAKRILALVKNKQIQKLKVLRFILLCIKFNDSLLGFGKGPKRIPNKEKLAAAMGEDAPEAVVNAIRRKFASETNDMPRWNTDNLMTHICAAALIVDGFEVDVNDLRNDLKLENKEIKQYFHELGCRVTPPTETDRAKLKITKAESASHNVAKLKLPLQFPKAMKGSAKRR